MFRTARLISLFATAATLAALPACKRASNAASSGGGAGGGTPDQGLGAQNDGPVTEVYDYASDEFNYERDGTITRSGKPFTGQATVKYADGNLKTVFTFKDGLYHGDIVEYYENGKRSSFKQYLEGKRHGITTYWDEGGVAIRQVLYEDDAEKEEITDTEKLKHLNQ